MSRDAQLRQSSADAYSTSNSIAIASKVFACMQATFIYTIAKVAVGLVCIRFSHFSLIKSHMKVSVFFCVYS